MPTLRTLSPSSHARIRTFVDEFIRSDDVLSLQADRDSDFINRRDRATRCYDAAEYGADGKTHAEVINDWRDAFRYWLRVRRRNRYTADPDRFESAVHAHFDRVESWHAANGSRFNQIG